MKKFPPEGVPFNELLLILNILLAAIFAPLERALVISNVPTVSNTLLEKVMLPLTLVSISINSPLVPSFTRLSRKDMSPLVP